MSTIQTTLHHYRFDTSKPGEKEAYDSLRRDVLEKIGFPVTTIFFAGDYAYGKTQRAFMEKIRASVGPCELETEHLFPDQWNGAELRLFNWSECVYPNKKIREGYYLDQTDAMRAVLRDTLKCGFCGKQEPADSGIAFCPHCLDSEFLTEKDLRLTRMAPVRDDRLTRAEPTDAERAHLVPLFHRAQVEGSTVRGKARIAKQRERVASEYDKAIRNATEKRDAAVWIMDNAPGIYANWIFYDHTGRHCFGWRKPLDAGTLSLLLDKISEFPFAYDIKCDDGRKLSGE